MSSGDTSPCICRIRHFWICLYHSDLKFLYCSLPICHWKYPLGLQKHLRCLAVLYVHRMKYSFMAICDQSWLYLASELPETFIVWNEKCSDPGTFESGSWSSSALPLDQGRSPRCGNQMDWRNIAWPRHPGIPFILTIMRYSASYKVACSDVMVNI